MFRRGVPLCEVMGLRHIIDHDASIGCGNASFLAARPQEVAARSERGEKSIFHGTGLCAHANCATMFILRYGNAFYLHF